MTTRLFAAPLRYFEYLGFIMPVSFMLDGVLPVQRIFLVLLVLFALIGSKIPTGLRRAARLSGLIALGLAWDPLHLYTRHLGSFVEAALLFWGLFGHPLDLMRLWMFGEEDSQRSEGLEAHLTDLAMAAGFVALMVGKNMVPIPILWYIAAAALPYVVKPPSRRWALVITVFAVVLDLFAWAPISALSSYIPAPAGTFLGHVIRRPIAHIAVCLWLIGGSPSRLRHVLWSRESAGPLEVDRGEPHDHSVAPATSGR